MQTVFGIDVSKATSEVAILVNGEKVHGYAMTNNQPGFARLLHDLEQMPQPEIVFEATGVYSRRLEAFLKAHHYSFTKLNPLEAKKQMDSLRHRKTDKLDAEGLARTQFILNRKASFVQEGVYEELRDLSRFYQNLTEDIVRAKNRLHKNLQSTFPELEQLLSEPTGEQYWNLVSLFPMPGLVLQLSREALESKIKTSTSKRISVHRVNHLAEKLLDLAALAYPAVGNHSPMQEVVRYYAQELLRLSAQRKLVLEQMISLAEPLPEYDIYLSLSGIGEVTAVSLIGELGDIRRFKNSNQINAFIGIDLRHYQSGDYQAQEHITKRGNHYARKILFKAIHNMVSASRTQPNHIADFYRKRKGQSPKTSTKPYTIAAMHRLVRCLYYLVTHNKKYDYSLSQS